VEPSFASAISGISAASAPVRTSTPNGNGSCLPR